MKVTIAETQAQEVKEIGYRVVNSRRAVDFYWIHSTHCWTGFVDGEIACMWGLVPPTLLSDQAYLWLVTTDLVKQHRFALVRHSQRMVEQALEIYPLIVGQCERGNEEAMRWIRWLGGTFGPWKDNLRPFEIRRKSDG